MLTISQFAAKCNTTVKTIRHYDNIGLLPADYISEESGYRYYRRNSIAKYYNIVGLKNAGFSLKEIAEKFSGFDVGDIIEELEKKALQLQKRKEICESIKKEYERIMAETNKITVAKLSQQISITSTEKNEHILWDVNPKIANKCVELLKHSLNAEQIINIDFDDLKEIASGKQVINVGKFYSPDCDVEGFDNIVINTEEEQATDLVVFFEASPDTTVDKITEAIESFMMNFACEANIIFAANAESGEKGLTLQWICMK